VYTRALDFSCRGPELRAHERRERAVWRNVQSPLAAPDQRAAAPFYEFLQRLPLGIGSGALYAVRNFTSALTSAPTLYAAHNRSCFERVEKCTVFTRLILGAHPSIHSLHSFCLVSGTFHSRFRVLFNFRSRYLFAIGLPNIFSLGGMLTATLAFESQRTRLADCQWTERKCSRNDSTGLSPSRASSSNELAHSTLRAIWRHFLQQCRPKREALFHCELFDVHSPLLIESLLFSFPPLSKMLQFSG